MKRQRGFTLIELMVALGIMALVALLSWRGLDAMVHARNHTQARSDRIAVLQTVLAQWRTDLDALAPDTLPRQQTLDWNGQSLRLLRLARAGQSSQDQSAQSSGLQVVAWTLRAPCGMPETASGACWMRWQSPVLHTRGDIQTAWQQAADWSSAGSNLPGQQQLLPLQSWQLLAWSDGAWTPLPTTALPPSSPASAPLPSSEEATPPALRLLLTLPDQAGMAGTLTVDWLRPSFTRERN